MRLLFATFVPLAVANQPRFRLPFPFALMQSDDPFEVMCDGCNVQCHGCSFDDPSLVPMCSDVMEHTNSSGGSVTVEELWIEPGYWRASQTSTDILECYRADACLGGVTGAPGYCRTGYEGPCEKD